MSLIGDLRKVGGEWWVESTGFAGQSYRGSPRGREYCVDQVADIFYTNDWSDSFGRRWRCSELRPTTMFPGDEPILMPDLSGAYLGTTPAGAFALDVAGRSCPSR